MLQRICIDCTAPVFIEQKLKPIDLGGGIMVGIPNYFATWLLLAALVVLNL
ncbi:MAG: hypothetical protein RSC13_01115 [Clostridium sp.]